MAARPQFEVVEDESPDSRTPPSDASRTEQIGISALALGLGALSKRALSALADLFFLSTVGSAFFLWYLTLEPTVNQIVSLTIYALFVLAANWLVRRK